MSDTLKIIPLILYLAIGFLSLAMAIKTLLARKFLPFHEEAYGKNWESIEKNLQLVFLALLKISGLGFLVIALLLLSSSIYNYFNPNFYLQFVVPFIALLFSIGLFIFNYFLFKRTKAKTPWKNSLFVMMVIIICIILSSV
jgi:hypothetical protein